MLIPLTRKFRFRLALAVLAGLALLASACSGDDTPSSTTPTSSAANGAAVAGFDGETLTLGYLTLQDEILADITGALLEGSRAYWNWLNSQGGVAGKYQVELEVGDALEIDSEYERLKDQVVMFANVVATEPTQQVLEHLKRDNIIAAPGSLAGAWAGEAVLLPIGAAYEYEMINLADWYVNVSALANADTRHCAINVNNPYGNAAARGLEHAMAELNRELTLRQFVSPSDTDLAVYVQALRDAGCTVVYSMVLAHHQHDLLVAADEIGFEPDWLGALPSYLTLFPLQSPASYQNFYMAFDAPPVVAGSEVPGMAKFLERFESHAGSEALPNPYHVGGYSQALTVHALLEKAAELGDDFSREGMAAAMAQLGEVEAEGLAPENYVYGVPAERQPASAVRIYRFDATEPPFLLREVGQIDSDHNASFDLTGTG